MANPNIANVTSIYGETSGALLTTTSLVSILAAPAVGEVLKINTILVTNVDGVSAADISMSIYNGADHVYFASTISVPPDSTLVLIDKNSSFYLDENWAIWAQASTGNDLSHFISYERITDT